MKYSDYDKLRIALLRISAGVHENGGKMTLAEARTIAEMALRSTHTSRGALNYMETRIEKRIGSGQ